MVSEAGKDGKFAEHIGDGVDDGLGVVEVGLLRLRPDVVGRVVAGQQDELNIGMGLVNLREHLPEHIPSSDLPLWEYANEIQDTFRIAIYEDFGNGGRGRVHINASVSRPGESNLPLDLQWLI